MIINNILDWIKLTYKTKVANFYGYSTLKEYERAIDKDCFQSAHRVKDFYYGYPYVHTFLNHKHEVYDWNGYTDGVYVITNWCEKYCSEKFRFDFLRVAKYSDEWHINDIGGDGDYVFAAFKSEKDYSMFLLRWA